MDDQIIWNSFLQGSKASFQMIYSKYYQNLYSYGMRKLNAPDMVRDCIQDLFVNLWSSRSKLSTTDNVRYYLLASLRNQIVRASVENGKWQKTALSSAENFEIQFNPETELIQKENLSQKAKMLITALDQLTPRQKEVLYLRYFEELSYEQIAELLDLTVKGVYKLNYRAIDALKSVLNISKSDLLLLLLVCKCELFR
ncbi:sigma-70 family RNA polymerase sigma factor [Mucilaginibacter rubeus]|uniref:Sigma-70 family RNA polymerase sigma factor n=1 Tax=Mucilaginibacter rubeus TaxID=2027860 RepID=A0AAE6JM62_9SPHI|nr:MULTISPECIES: sigma-70 family RNA polymerase sigma factor [Mucilaginibacter]QEM07157.1 sigma-70 family RNA polymerase sigma factor [Mucilaginibacter rubeus]QEM19612.1 sigma-70 family RNA polymerase sigma factor [Mucilaginibacter gossypii]QTE43698.1 sigma-70 family RNA polymerase sigma factor [Mucilaginibacter rubeus]QTE50298.1 sigma-70 family RNA polymerase sigma factor [Mucilaginibacter rubeus]QTE55385.1 sigma-70 family RNA polymerase sigma factor [Mucilaginibacter rubeus]